MRNFDQIKVGDEVVTSYTQAVAWQVKRAGEGAPGISTQDEVKRAQPGEKPGGSVGSSVTVTATITAIDLANDTVTITGPGGQSRTIKARNPANLQEGSGRRSRRHHVHRSGGNFSATGHQEVGIRQARGAGLSAPRGQVPGDRLPHSVALLDRAPQHLTPDVYK